MKTSPLVLALALAITTPALADSTNFECLCYSKSYLTMKDRLKAAPNVTVTLKSAQLDGPMSINVTIAAVDGAVYYSPLKASWHNARRAVDGKLVNFAASGLELTYDFGAKPFDAGRGSLWYPTDLAATLVNGQTVYEELLCGEWRRIDVNTARTVAHSFTYLLGPLHEVFDFGQRTVSIVDPLDGQVIRKLY